MKKVTTLLLLLCAIYQTASSVITDGLLPNGDFREVPQPSHLNGTIITNPKAIPYWTLSGFVEYIKPGSKQGDVLLIVPHHMHALRLGNEASIKQKIRVVKGGFYSISFSVARTCAHDEKSSTSPFLPTSNAVTRALCWSRPFTPVPGGNPILGLSVGSLCCKARDP